MNKKNGKANNFFHFEGSVHSIEPDNSWKNNNEFDGKKMTAWFVNFDPPIY